LEHSRSPLHGHKRDNVENEQRELLDTHRENDDRDRGDQ